MKFWNLSREAEKSEKRKKIPEANVEQNLERIK
jgi:hypothetical protein